MKYLVVYERAAANWSAYVPDLPGCVATAETLDDVRLSMSGAVGEYVERLRRSGEALPKPAAQVGTIEVELAIA